MARIDDGGEEPAGPAPGEQLSPMWPLAAVRRPGQAPSLGDIMAAYLWRVNGEYDASSPAGVSWAADDRLRLMELMFPTPSAADTDVDCRSLVAKVVVADGLWADYEPGRPFGSYERPDGSAVYADDEADELERAFDAVEAARGRLWLVEAAVELATVLVMPK